MADEKRQRMIDAARKRFGHFGVRKTTMQEIARDAGVAVGTLYLYFKDKDDLLIACTEEYVQRHRRQAEAILGSKLPASRKLREYVLDRFRAAEATRKGFGHVAELTREVLRVCPDRRFDEARLMADSFGRILRAGIDTGELFTRDPDRDARVLLFSLAFLFPSATDEPAYTPSEQDALFVVDWFLGVWQAQRRRAPKRVKPDR